MQELFQKIEGFFRSAHEAGVGTELLTAIVTIVLMCLTLWLTFNVLKLITVGLGNLLWEISSRFCNLFVRSEEEFHVPEPRKTRPLPPAALCAPEGKPTPMMWNPCLTGPYYYFMDFYESSRHWDENTSLMTKHFNEEVNRFKDWGNPTMWYSYLQAIKSLNREDVLVIFMPCATPERYMKRWADLSTYLHHFGIRTGLNMIKVTDVRQIAHFNMKEHRRIVRNYEIDIPEGSVCVIIDDVRTSGASCADLANVIKEKGSFVIGAIVMAQVPRLDWKTKWSFSRYWRETPRR